MEILMIKLYITSPTSDGADEYWCQTEEEAKTKAWEFLKQGWQVFLIQGGEL